MKGNIMDKQQIVMGSSEIDFLRSELEFFRKALRTERRKTKQLKDEIKMWRSVAQHTLRRFDKLRSKL